MGVTDQNHNSLDDDCNWVVANIELPIDGVPLEMKVSVPKIPVRPQQLLRTFQQMCNAFVELSVQRTEAAGEKITCRAGCGACCRQLVPISELEARQLNELVNALPEHRQQEIRRRFEVAKQKLQAADLLEIVRHPDRFADQVLVDTAKAYFRLGIPCPFLEQESCSIHADRPLACREYLVTSPASCCAGGTGEYQTGSAHR